MGKYDDVRMQWTGRRAGQQTYFALTDVSQLVAASNESRVWLSIQNRSTTNKVYLALGEDAIVPGPGLGTGLVLDPLDTIIFDKNMPWPHSIYAICDAGLTAVVLVNDVVQVIRDFQGRGTKQNYPPALEWGE